MYNIYLNNTKSLPEFLFLNKGNFFLKTLRIFFTREEFRLMSPVTSTFFLIIFLIIFIYVFISLDRWFIEKINIELNDYEYKVCKNESEVKKIVFISNIVMRVSCFILPIFVCFAIFFLY